MNLFLRNIEEYELPYNSGLIIKRLTDHGMLIQKMNFMVKGSGSPPDYSIVKGKVRDTNKGCRIEIHSEMTTLLKFAWIIWGSFSGIAVIYTTYQSLIIWEFNWLPVQIFIFLFIGIVLILLQFSTNAHQKAMYIKKILQIKKGYKIN